MRIGIITYWQSNDNYGQQLQCWALQHYLRGKGHDAYLIRYKFEGRQATKKPLLIKILKALTIYPIFRHYLRKKRAQTYKEELEKIEKKNIRRNFKGFRLGNLVLSEKEYKTLAELQSDPPIADMYITGSDQVWAQSLKDKENEVFFLNFGEKGTKRVSYAASFGMQDYPQGELPILRQNLKRFDAISVRENSGISICKSAGYKAVKVLDPTLLLDAADYSFLKGDNNTRKDYVYIYSLNINKPQDIYFEEILAYAKSNNLNLIVTPASGRTLGREIFGCDVTYDYATIPQWISNIKHARLVVTTSFHGIVFCIIMHTPFVYIPLRGKNSSMNNRILDILEALNLNQRIASALEDINNIVKNKINWDLVDEMLKNYRKDSKEFINKVIS